MGKKALKHPAKPEEKVTKTQKKPAAVPRTQTRLPAPRVQQAKRSTSSHRPPSSCGDGASPATGPPRHPQPDPRHLSLARLCQERSGLWPRWPLRQHMVLCVQSGRRAHPHQPCASVDARGSGSNLNQPLLPAHGGSASAAPKRATSTTSGGNDTYYDWHTAPRWYRDGGQVPLFPLVCHQPRRSQRYHRHPHRCQLYGPLTQALREWRQRHRHRRACPAVAARLADLPPVDQGPSMPYQERQLWEVQDRRQQASHCLTPLHREPDAQLSYGLTHLLSADKQHSRGSSSPSTMHSQPSHARAQKQSLQPANLALEWVVTPRDACATHAQVQRDMVGYPK